MLSVIALLLLTVDPPATKPLPPVKEPDWNAWKSVDPKAKQQATEAFTVLRDHRADRQYKTDAEREAAEAKVDAAYKALEGNPEAACASGVEILAAAKDDWERLMIATTVGQLGGEKGEPFLVWTMASARTVDDAFEPAFAVACGMAARRKAEYLPAIFLMLRTHEGHIFLPLH